MEPGQGVPDVPGFSPRLGAPSARDGTLLAAPSSGMVGRERKEPAVGDLLLNGPGAGTEGVERRWEPRISNPPLRIGGLPAVVSDVSLGGVCLVLSSPLALGERVGLALTDNIGPSTRQFRAEVLWQRGAQSGFRWLDLELEERRWLEGCIERWEAPGAELREERPTLGVVNPPLCGPDEATLPVLTVCIYCKNVRVPPGSDRLAQDRGTRPQIPENVRWGHGLCQRCYSDIALPMLRRLGTPQPPLE